MRKEASPTLGMTCKKWEPIFGSDGKCKVRCATFKGGRGAGGMPRMDAELACLKKETKRSRAKRVTPAMKEEAKARVAAARKRKKK
jgi:hypothetical protein